MKLSVIIPFYKGEVFVHNCVSSIVASYCKIKPGCLSLELFVIIDSNTTVEEVKILLPADAFNFFNITIEKNEFNVGVAATRNRGISLATGDYIYLIDQDDKVFPDFLERVFDFMTLGADFILCNGLYHFAEKNFTLKIYYFRPAITLKNIALKDIIRSPGQVVVKRSVISEYKFPVPLKHYGCDDKFCWISIFAANPSLKTGYVHQCIYNATMHEANYSNAYRELYYCGLELWNTILHKSVSSEINALASRNMNFYKHMLKAKRSAHEYFSGMFESVCYHFYPNKLLSFTIKKAKSVLAG